MKMYKTKEVAEILGVTRKTVWNMIQRGTFPNAKKIDPSSKSIILIPEEDVINLINKQRIGNNNVD